MWTCPGILFGKMKEDMGSSDPSGTVTLLNYLDSSGNQQDIKINNFYGGELTQDTKVSIGYDASDNTLKIISAGCVSN